MCEVVDSRRENGSLVGKIKNADFPIELKDLFHEYESRVNDLVFGELDQIVDNIEAYGLLLVHEEITFNIEDVQVMNEDDICFKILNEVT